MSARSRLSDSLILIRTPVRPGPGLLTCWLVVGLALCGCGARYGQRVPDSVIHELPYESRIELLEAENELAVALDRSDEARNEVNRAREGLRRAKSRLSAAENEVDEATDASSKEVAELAVKEGKAKVAFLRARQKVNVALADIEGLALRCAFARFERSRLEAARRAKVQGAESLAVSTFDEQVKACEQEVAEERAELAEPEKALAEAKQNWDAQRTLLSKRTFDARASPFVE